MSIFVCVDRDDTTSELRRPLIVYDFYYKSRRTILFYSKTTIFVDFFSGFCRARNVRNLKFAKFFMDEKMKNDEECRSCWRHWVDYSADFTYSRCLPSWTYEICKKQNEQRPGWTIRMLLPLLLLHLSLHGKNIPCKPYKSFETTLRPFIQIYRPPPCREFAERVWTKEKTRR